MHVSPNVFQQNIQLIPFSAVLNRKIDVSIKHLDIQPTWMCWEWEKQRRTGSEGGRVRDWERKGEGEGTRKGSWRENRNTKRFRVASCETCRRAGTKAVMIVLVLMPYNRMHVFIIGREVKMLFYKKNIRLKKESLYANRYFKNIASEISGCYDKRFSDVQNIIEALHIHGMNHWSKRARDTDNE